MPPILTLMDQIWLNNLSSQKVEDAALLQTLVPAPWSQFFSGETWNPCFFFSTLYLALLALIATNAFSALASQYAPVPTAYSYI